MKNTDLYYKTVLRRRNIIGDAILAFFLSICSWPRLLLEVILRRNMGERYYNATSAVLITVLMAAGPVVYSETLRYVYHNSGLSLFFTRFLTWYGFLAVFTYMSFLRYEEVRRLPGAYDFARFSLSPGRINDWFYTVNIGGVLPTAKVIETVLEPGVFFVAGLFLWLIGQPLGILLIICSVIYSVSYFADYTAGDNYILDQIDQRICNEELVKTFVDDDDQQDTRGFHFYGRRPANPDARRQIAEILNQNEETVEAF